MKRYSKLMAFLLALAIVFSGGLQERSVAEASKEGTSIERIAGKGRVETSIEASKLAFEDGQAANVVLAGYNGEVDALTGTLLAHAKKAPLILTRTDRLTDEVKAELDRLGAANIYVLGGDKAVSSNVLNELAKSYTVKRISGANREETAVAVAKEVKDQTDNIFLAKGYGVLADVLSVGPVSAVNNFPVFLTNTNRIKASTLQAMKDMGVKKVTIIGGEQAVSKSVENQLKDYEIRRISGSNRSNTALKIAETYFRSSKKAVVASGYLYVDALVGGYLGARNNAPIILTNTDSLSNNTRDFIRANTDNAYVLGGTKVISQKLYGQVERLIKYPDEPDPEEPKPEDPKPGDTIDLPNRTINYLETGEDVKKVQIALVKLGYNISVDGSYGPGTRDAILDFQKRYASLVNNGIYGPNTRTFMIRELKAQGGSGGGNDKPSGAKLEDRGVVFTSGKASDQVALLKDFFRARGEKNIPNDYMYDSRTIQLVRNYQKENGLKIDGIAGPGTMAKMNQEIKNKNYKISLKVPHIKNSGDLLMINRSSNTLYFIRNGVIQNTYPVATGRSRSSLTPDGKFKIIVKFKNPAWGGAGMYPPIAGGDPKNPLGTRWLGLSIRGGGVYGVHGNADPSSIGGFISLGCVRMFNKDVEALYDKVKKDTPIWIGSEGMLEGYGVNFK